MTDNPCLHLTGLEHRPLFQLHGLEWDEDGALRLERLPGGFASTGTFLAGPITAGPRPAAWSSLHLVDAVPHTQTGLRLFSLASAASSPPALPDVLLVPPAGLELTPLDVWRAHLAGALEMALPHPPARCLWLAGYLSGDGLHSPAIGQARLEYDPIGWSRHLPAIYQRSGPQPDFLEQLLALFENATSPLEQALDDLPLLFDPAAAPAGGWLEWLAGWLAFEMDSDWDEATARQALAGAFQSYGRRGTLAGMKEAITLYTGLEADIDEPSRQAELWSLGHTSTLGFGTMLASAEPAGAVTGDTALLDRSHLLPEENFGAPLFEDLAWRFSVRIHSPRLDDPALVEKLARVVDREKPAHTAWQLCRIENRLRVGLQASLGVDAWVAPAAPPLRAGLGGPLGLESHLSPDPDEPEGSTRIGAGARLGSGTHLT